MTQPHRAQHYLGSWEMDWRYIFPNFLIDPSPCGPALFGKLGNGLEVHFFANFLNDPSPYGPALFLKMGKFGTLNSKLM